MTRFAIIILSYNSRDWLEGLLPLLFVSTYKNFKVILADNNSKDGSVSFVRSNYPQVKILDFDDNLGYSLANNQAGMWALQQGYDVLVFLNSDTRVGPEWLERAKDYFLKAPDIGIAGPIFRNWDGDGVNEFIKKRYLEISEIERLSNLRELDVDWVEGSALFIRSECARQVGLFDPIFFMYWEDADICRRARTRGWRVTLMPRCEVRHFGGGNSAATIVPLKMLKEQNEFIYLLTDPNQTIARNILGSIRLMLTKLNSASFGSHIFQRAYNCLKVFHACIRKRRRIIHKWRQDRLILDSTYVRLKLHG